MPPQELEKNTPAAEIAQQEPTPKDLETAFRETFVDLPREQQTAIYNAITHVMAEAPKQEAPALERPKVGETQHPYDVGRIGINALSKEFNIPLTGETRNPDEVGRIGLDAVRKEFEPQTPIPAAEAPKVEETNREQLIGRIGLAAVEKELELPAPKDPSIIPPQTKEGVTSYSEADITAMAGTETHLEALKRKTVEYGGALKQSTAEFLPDSFIGRAGTRAQILGIELLSAPKKAVLEGMYRWRSERAAKAEARTTLKDAEVKRLEAVLAEQDKSTEKIKSGGPALYDATVAAKVESERHDTLQRIESAKVALHKATTNLEYKNNKKKYWEDKENALAERVVGKVEALLQPSRAKFEELTLKKASIREKLESLKRAQDMGSKGITDLEVRLKNNPTAIENVEIHTTLDAVKELMKRIESDLSTLTNKDARVAAKMNRVNLKIGIGEVAKAKQENATAGRNTPEYSFSNAAPKQEVKVEAAPSAADTAKRMHTVPVQDTTPKPVDPAAAPVVEAPPMTGYDETVIDTSAAVQEATPEKKADGIEIVHIDPVAYLLKWNELFKNEMPMTGQDIINMRPAGISWNDLTAKQFTLAFKQTLQKKIGGNTVYTKAGEKIVYTEQAMEERLNKAFDSYKEDLKKTAIN